MNTMLKLSNYHLVEIKKEEQITLSGGAPTKDTSFAYDFFYFVTALFRGAYEMGKAARGNPHI